MCAPDKYSMMHERDAAIIGAFNSLEPDFGAFDKTDLSRGDNPKMAKSRGGMIGSRNI